MNERQLGHIQKSLEKWKKDFPDELALATGALLENAGLPANATLRTLILYIKGVFDPTAIADQGAHEIGNQEGNPMGEDQTAERSGVVTVSPEPETMTEHALSEHAVWDVVNKAYLDYPKYLASALTKMMTNANIPKGTALEDIIGWLNRGITSAYISQKELDDATLAFRRLALIQFREAPDIFHAALVDVCKEADLDDVLLWNHIKRLEADGKLEGVLLS